MNKDWQMTDGFVNQNVTPHSPTFDLTMPACRDAATTSTVVALTCATGGTCIVGDTGPGGGKVFYVHASGTFACGATLGSTCKYLEAATSDLAGSAWCSDTASSLGVTATGIGSGMSNTTTADTTCASGAIQAAADYTNNGKTDWHLPSKDELNQLYTNSATVGGFSAGSYWSSSEFNATNAWIHNFLTGNQFINIKSITYSVRPVRAFG